ncbi:dentin sialophosphoprotein [Trifolium pratense]|uniref:Dentin sialophosphoprotein n=1 Tax=Trifolium pratense TaxID=57577 RepID=A0A2K3NYR7_TRIPR|nr:dentin sialophosphoprotein [Trifolium pratense]
MEERKRKFVCKYCLKRFPCGKSLGGHIRTHMTEERTHAAAAAAIAAAAAADIKRDFEPVVALSDGGNGNPIYGLRENPKKTIKFVHSHNHVASAAAATTALEHEMIKFCKECGKGFPSLKALCGHMASHSEKEKKIKEDTQSDDDDDDDDDTCVVAASTMNLRKNKRRIRFKSLTLSNQPSSSSVNGSSSVSEMEQEQQEVARCLMLLSRDFFSHKGRFVSESSNNNSVLLETKSKIVIRNGNKLVSSNAHGFVEEKKKLKSVGGIGISINSDSTAFKYGSKKIKIVDSNVSKYEFKRPKMEEEDKSRFENCRKKAKYEELDHDRKFDSRKKAKYEEIYESDRKSLKYEFFRSEKDKHCSYDSITDDESDEQKSSESDSFSAAKSHNSKLVNKKKSSNKGKKKKKLKSKKSKEYECPICYKIFKSGQALGGHKRSHFVGGSEDNTFVIKQSVAPCLIDLNQPAPVDE